MNVRTFFEKLVDEEIPLEVYNRKLYKNYFKDRFDDIILSLEKKDNYLYNQGNIVFEVVESEPDINFKLRTVYADFYYFKKRVFLIDPLINLTKLETFISSNEIKNNDIYSIIFQLFYFGNRTNQNRKAQIYIKTVEPYTIEIVEGCYLYTNIKVKMENVNVNIMKVLKEMKKIKKNDIIDKLLNLLPTNNIVDFFIRKDSSDIFFKTTEVINNKNNFREKIYGDKTYIILETLEKDKDKLIPICDKYGIVIPKNSNIEYVYSEIRNLNPILTRPMGYNPILYQYPNTQVDFHSLTINEILSLIYPIRIYDWNDRNDLIGKITKLYTSCEFDRIANRGIEELFRKMLDQEKMNDDTKYEIRKYILVLIQNINFDDLKIPSYLPLVISNINKIRYRAGRFTDKIIKLFTNTISQYQEFVSGNNQEILRRKLILLSYFNLPEEWMNPLYSKHCLLQILGNRYFQERKYEARLDIPFTRYITEATPRLPYSGSRYDRITVVHIGQRKLLLSEIEFLTLYGHLAKDVVYAGAAPGTHITLLSKMFPDLTFHLYDPLPFHESLKKYPKIHTHQQLFLNETIDEFVNTPTLFISDIRSVDTEGILKTGENANEKIDEGITIDMTRQYEWCIRLKPKMASLKFRLPWVTKEKITIDPKIDQTIYLDGNIHYQSWVGKGSTEGRLFTDCTKNKIYSNLEYEEKMSFHNKVERIALFNHTEYPGLYDHCYDCSAEVYILEDYIKRYGHFDMYKLNKMMMKSITGKCHNKLCSVLDTEEIDKHLKNKLIIKKQYVQGRPDYQTGN